MAALMAETIEKNERVETLRCSGVGCGWEIVFKCDKIGEKIKIITCPSCLSKIYFKRYKNGKKHIRYEN